MPPKPRLESERARQAVIAALMLAILLLSLAAAYAFTVRQRGPAAVPLGPFRLGELEVQVPRGWVRRVSLQRDRGLAQAIFDDPRRPEEHVLTIFAMPPLPAAAHRDIEDLLTEAFGGTPDDAGAEEFELNGLKVRRSATHVRTPVGSVHQLAAVVETADGNRHWLILVMGRNVEGADDPLYQQDQRLLSAMLETLQVRDRPNGR